MKRVLVDVDTQVDFVELHGALHVPVSPSVRDTIERMLRAAPRDYDAVIGSVDSHAYDAWEFAENGGPFPPHCVKGTPGWLRVWHELPRRIRFVPMMAVTDQRVTMVVGEDREGAGNRVFDAAALVREARQGVGLYFEKEVYSLFSNPAAEPVVETLARELTAEDPDGVVFDVIGYCTGGYCVDAAARELALRGHRVRIFGGATAPLGGDEGVATTRRLCAEHGVQWLP